MDMSTAVKTVLSKYVTFSGRASRPEFWWWVLFAIIVGGIAYVIDGVLGFHSRAATDTGPIAGIVSLLLLLPGLAVTVRRLHDSGRSGWWYFIVLIPLIGGLILLYWMLKPSEPGTNRFG